MNESKKKWCPRCDQGWVCSALIIPLKKNIYICDECDAIWFEENKIENTNFEDFTTYMETHKLPGTWDQLQVNEEK